MDYIFYITEVILIFLCVIMVSLLCQRMSLFNMKCILNIRSIVRTLYLLLLLHSRMQMTDEYGKHSDPPYQIPESQFRPLWQRSSE